MDNKKMEMIMMIMQT